jgi:RNA-splicing ligase RtcB
MKIQGKYNSATVFTDNIDKASLNQLYSMLNIPCFADSKIAVMPDVHLGRGSVVGFTMTCNDFINPQVIGVDIGCGVTAYNLGPQDIDLAAFDAFIHAAIPAGSNVHPEISKKLVKENKALDNLIQKVAPREHRRILLSIGTLGGGNHFLELDRDEQDNIWLIIHSGSRNLGLQVCRYHHRIACQVIKEAFQGAGAFHGMEYMPLNNGGEEYLQDMQIAQTYAEENRKTMAAIIIEGFFNKQPKDYECISSTHNYVNFEDMIIRKGAISAHEDELVIIPLNMRDGCLLAKGKGNEDWNCSAPHGAGRLLKRSETRELISLEEYQKSMQGIYSSCIRQNTIDESPMAYKDAEELMSLIGDTVEIISAMKPIYSFKA